MNKNILSPAEWEIMNTVWKLNRKTTVREILDLNYPNGEKAYTTIQTLMNILVEKKYLTKKKIGLVNFYVASKSQSKSVFKETKNFVKRVYDGSFVSLASFLVQSGSLTKEEIEELKRLIAENEGNE